MTEFKKLTAIVNDELISKLPILFPNNLTTSADYSIEKRYETYITIERLLPDVHRRFLKMIRRARETDPEKQMFNEKTRQGMEELYVNRYIHGFIDLYYEFETQKRNIEEEYDVDMRAEKERLKFATAAENGGVSDDDDHVEDVLDNRQNKKYGLTLCTSFEDFIAMGETHHSGTMTNIWGDAMYDDITTWEHGSVIRQLELEYAAHLLRTAEQASATQAAVHNLEDLKISEERKRNLLMAKELADRQTNIIESGRVSHSAAREAQEARELIIWETELIRRQRETNRNATMLAIQRRQVPCEGGRTVNVIMLRGDDEYDESDGPLSQEFFLSEPLSTAISTISSIYSPLMSIVLLYIIELLSEVLATPDSPNIRVIRNDSITTICSFGHPCIMETSRIYEAVETVLVLAAAYQVRYSKYPSLRTRDIMSLCERSSSFTSIDTHTCFSSLAKKDINGQLAMTKGSHTAVLRLYAPVPPALLNPTQQEDYRIQLTYSKMTFEPYSERVLVLKEPDALHDPHEWCDWHKHLKYTVKYLKSLVPNRR